MIALISDEDRREALTALLSEFDEVKFYKNATELAYYLEDKNPCRLAVVERDGAGGMNDCAHVACRKALDAALWITEQEEFIHQSRRMGVAGFLVKPVSDETIRETVKRILDDG